MQTWLTWEPSSHKGSCTGLPISFSNLRWWRLVETQATRIPNSSDSRRSTIRWCFANFRRSRCPRATQIAACTHSKSQPKQVTSHLRTTQSGFLWYHNSSNSSKTVIRDKVWPNNRNKRVSQRAQRSIYQAVVELFQDKRDHNNITWYTSTQCRHTKRTSCQDQVTCNPKVESRCTLNSSSKRWSLTNRSWVNIKQWLVHFCRGPAAIRAFSPRARMGGVWSH